MQNEKPYDFPDDYTMEQIQKKASLEMLKAISENAVQTAKTMSDLSINAEKDRDKIAAGKVIFEQIRGKGQQRIESVTKSLQIHSKLNIPMDKIDLTVIPEPVPELEPPKPRRILAAEGDNRRYELDKTVQLAGSEIQKENIDRAITFADPGLSPVVPGSTFDAHKGGK